jgi:hypothetical protein
MWSSIDKDGDFVAKGWVIACDQREVVLYNDLNEDHIGLLILHCLNDILIVISIWKLPLFQTTLDGNSLNALLKSYDENCMLEWM